MGNSANSNVIGKGKIPFHTDDGCITTLQGVRHVLESRYNLISLESLHEEGFNFNSEDDLMISFQRSHVKFQAERADNVYMLRNLDVTVGGLQSSSASRLDILK